MSQTGTDHRDEAAEHSVFTAKGRWWLVSALAAFSMTSYLARANISVASETMSGELGLDHIRMGQVFSSFLVGYALFQVVGGAIGDRFGPRLTLGISALLWSVASVLTGLLPAMGAGVSVFAILCLVRFVLGAAEATTFPVGNLVVRERLEASQHASGTAVMFLGTSLASAITGPLVSYLMVRFGWRWAFYGTAIPPLLLGAAWLALAPRDRPDSAPVIVRGTRTDTAGSGGDRLMSILLRRNVLLLIASYVSEGYVLFLFVFWLYTYLVEKRGFSLINAGWLAAAPWLTALVLTPVGGYLCDRGSRLHGKASGARTVIVAGYVGSGALLYVAAYAPQRWLCLVGLCLSIAFLMAAEPGFWTYAAHVAEDHVGVVSGIMNTAGIVGGIASTALVPVLVRSFGWGVALASATIMAFGCAALWLLVRDDRAGTRAIV